MTDWTSHFPDLDDLTGDARRDLLTATRILDLDPDSHVFGPGVMPQAALLVLKGSVRVQQVTEQGREIVLYRVHAGESCVLTTACLLSGDVYSADGWTETAATAAAIPKATFDHLLASSPEFRTFVFAAYSRRIADLFLTIEYIAFQRMDIRLAGRLLTMARDGVVLATHHHMAAELGSAREVISRLLKEFERRGWVSQARGLIRITDLKSLENLASQSS